MIPAAFLFSGLDLIFAISAIVGGGLFILRLALLLFGIGHDGDFSGADMGHVDAAGDAAGHDAGQGDGFRLLTVNGGMGFLMMFGLLGLALHRGSHVGETLSIIGAFAGGVAMMALMAKLFQVLQGLVMSGNLDYHGAVGQQGTVYLTIPEAGAGQVEVCISNRMRVMDAIAEDKKPIKTGERVDIVEITGNTLIVRRH